MSASGDPQADWLAPPLWDSLKRLESRHRQLQREHDLARRRLDQEYRAAVHRLAAQTDVDGKSATTCKSEL